MVTWSSIIDIIMPVIVRTTFQVDPMVMRFIERVQIPLHCIFRSRCCHTEAIRQVVVQHACDVSRLVEAQISFHVIICSHSRILQRARHHVPVVEQVERIVCMVHLRRAVGRSGIAGSSF